jgi:hypothetical protein
MKQPIRVDEEYAQFLIEEAQNAQTKFWNTLSALESQLNVELNSTKDLEHVTIGRLLVDPEMWESSSVPEPARIFDNRELSTMLHSLKLLQGALRNRQDRSCLENGVCSHLEGVTMLTVAEIDSLCERLMPA